MTKTSCWLKPSVFQYKRGRSSAERKSQQISGSVEVFWVETMQHGVAWRCTCWCISCSFLSMDTHGTHCDQVMKTGAFMVQKVWQSFSAENSGVSQNVENLFLKMKGKYDLIMLIAVDLGIPHFWTPIVFCSAVRSSHLFFVARTCSIRGKPQPFLLALRNDRNMDSNGQNISGDLVVEGLSKMLFRCSIFFVLCCLCPQWINGHGFVEPRPSMTKLPSFSGMFPGGHPWHVNILMKNIRWGFEFHGCYRHQVSMISVIYWWILIRSGEKLQISTYLDSEIFADVRDLPWISRISTAREESTGHHRDLLGTQWWNQVSTSTFHMNLSGKLRLKHVKTQIWWSIMFFPLIDCYSEGISYFQTAEWLMIYELFHNVSQCFTMFHMFHGGFFDLDGFLAVKLRSH